jgi:SpoVK/Ycf46/Vps4 family AAA+-type ATPase
MQEGSCEIILDQKWKRCKQQTPCLVLIDDIDSLTPKGSQNGSK